jgi:uncharacterized membrane protein YdjX (TVP38/TMEM64 family)
MADGTETTTTEHTAKKSFSVKRLAPLGLIIAGIVAFFALGLDRYVTFDALQENREALTSFVDNNLVVALGLFIILYATATALSLPGGLVLTITGGFLFGAWLGTGAVVVAATIGATLIFLIAKTALGEPLRQKAGPWLKKMEDGFQEDAMSYLLVLRLVPLFPFFVVNLVPAFLGVKLRTFVLATFFGIIPGTFVFALAGSGIGSVFDSGEEFTAGGILTPQVIAAFVGLAVLAIIPVGYKKWKARKSAV